MKMKKACEATSLTERAIRLYLSKNLIVPRQVNGLIDFSPEDIQHLKDIAVLRQFDFTIEQISSMIHEPAAISDIIRVRLDNAQAGIEHENEVCDILGKLDGETFDSLHSVAAQIREQRAEPPEPDFCRFDEITDEERHQQRLVAIKDLSKIEKRTLLLRWLVAGVCLVLGVSMIAGIYLCQTRIEGFISVSPMTVVELHDRMLMIEDAKVTIQTSNERTVEALGRDTITVPYSAYGRPLETGMTLDHACQLTVELTNLDLLRMGINPLQNMKTQSDEINDEWMRYILQRLFDQEYVDKVKLVVQEYTGLMPLFRQREP